MVRINELKHRLDLVLVKRIVQSLHYLLELTYRQLPTLVLVVSRKRLVQGQLLRSQDLVQLDETLLHPYLEVGRHFVCTEILFEGF